MEENENTGLMSEPQEEWKGSEGGKRQVDARLKDREREDPYQIQ